MVKSEEGAVATGDREGKAIDPFCQLNNQTAIELTVEAK